MDINRIKRLTIIALASDDELVETIVLKGGNAIDLAYSRQGTLHRTSYDLDFSIEDDFFKESEQMIRKRIERTLTQTFAEHDLIVLDYRFVSKPKNIKEEIADFWGGYQVTFKVVEKEKYNEKKGDIGKLRNAAIPLNPNSSTTFEIEFSKFEYIGNKKPISVDGYTIYVYTPEMIVFEKLRALCQQLPQYAQVIPAHSPRARARDFYDIHYIMEQYELDPTTGENKWLIEQIFAAKKVPLIYLKELSSSKAIHQDDWKSVQDTLSRSESAKSFDFYFEFVIRQFASLTFP